MNVNIAALGGQVGLVGQMSQMGQLAAGQYNVLLNNQYVGTTTQAGRLTTGPTNPQAILSSGVISSNLIPAGHTVVPNGKKRY